MHPLALLLSFLFVIVPISSSHAAYRSPVWSKNGMAATPHSEATKAAVEILERGGNAVDAAVAAAYALSVVEQYHSGLGGGEFALVRMAETDEIIALDARETAPGGASSDIYLDPNTGGVVSKKSYRGGLAVGVPGSIAGREELMKRFGSLSHSDVLQPSIRLAKTGYSIDRIMAQRIERYQDILSEDATASEIYFKDGKPIQRGEILIQPSLAKLLSNIAKKGAEYFYSGVAARLISQKCQSKGGILNEQDLLDYKVVWRKPISFSYRKNQIYSMPPPSSGGVCLAEILNILEQYPLDFLNPNSAEYYHLLASAFELAFADRAMWLGDPDYNVLPVGGLISKVYAREASSELDIDFRNKVTQEGDPWKYHVGGNTSHLSVIDGDGNMCSITTSVNTSFGSLVYVGELGIFLNSTMNDFALKPSEANKWGLVGGSANSIEPGKRPLSSMSPTLILRDDQPYMCIGSVGGPRIITSVAQIILNMIDHEMNIQAAIDAPRIHMQWKPDKLYLEKEISPDVDSELRKRGWTVSKSNHWSLSQGIMYDIENLIFYGASDARGVGSAGSPMLK